MKSKKILIVDDEISILNSMRRLLEDDFEIETASNVKEALNKIHDNNSSIDIILSDFMMPEMTGEDFYNYLSEHHTELKYKLIFMTGARYTTNIENFIKKNNCHILGKPFSHDELLKIIKNVINK